MFVYMVVNLVNGKYYIGKTIEKNLTRYWWNQKYVIFHQNRTRTSKPILYAAVRKYGWENFAIYPILTGTDNAELVQWERIYIKAFKSQHPLVGYNICDGGEGVPGRPCSPETRAKIGAANAITALGRKQSEAEKEKHRASTLALQEAGIVPKGRPKGYHHSEETLAKMRAAAAGRVISAEARAKSSASHKGKPWTAAQRAASRNPTGTGRLTPAERQSRYRARNKDYAAISEA